MCVSAKLNHLFSQLFTATFPPFWSSLSSFTNACPFVLCSFPVYVFRQSCYRHPSLDVSAPSLRSHRAAIPQNPLHFCFRRVCVDFPFASLFSVSIVALCWRVSESLLEEVVFGTVRATTSVGRFPRIVPSAISRTSSKCSPLFIPIHTQRRTQLLKLGKETKSTKPYTNQFAPHANTPSQHPIECKICKSLTPPSTTPKTKSTKPLQITSK